VAVQHGITVLNSPGIIDSGYRGEIRVPLVNLGDLTITLNPGDRIAQLLVLSVAASAFVPVDVLGESERGAAGFGSTGVE
jgi:dUTP pyrophosphatase